LIAYGQSLSFSDLGAHSGTDGRKASNRASGKVFLRGIDAARIVGVITAVAPPLPIAPMCDDPALLHKDIDPRSTIGDHGLVDRPPRTFTMED